MKKILPIILIIMMFACSKDTFVGPDLTQVDVPKELEIKTAFGLKTESIIVSNEVRINAKLPYTGTYRIKIRDINNELVSQEIITANEGNNLLKAYVNTLPKSSYTLQLTDDNHRLIGTETIVVN